MLKITTITLIIILFFTFTILISRNRKSVSSQEERTYEIRLDNNIVYLFENNKKVKKYDIDITVLPGEDIEILLDGINVKSISEADIIAEDYDG